MDRAIGDMAHILAIVVVNDVKLGGKLGENLGGVFCAGRGGWGGVLFSWLRWVGVVEGALVEGC